MKSNLKFLLIIFLLSISLLLFSYLFGIGSFIICGLEFNTIGSLAKFMAIYLIATFPVDSFTDLFYKAIREMGDMSFILYSFLCYFTDVSFYMFTIGILQYFIKDVNCSIWTAFLFCNIDFLLNLHINLKFSPPQIRRN